MYVFCIIIDRTSNSFVYINDIAEVFRSASRLFADDTFLMHASSSCEEISTVLNNDLVALNVWSKRWLVNFNPNKTDVIFISNAINLNVFELLFDGIFLDFSETHKHLGGTLNAKGKWGDHIHGIYVSVMKKNKCIEET